MDIMRRRRRRRLLWVSKLLFQCLIISYLFSLDGKLKEITAKNVFQLRIHRANVWRPHRQPGHAGGESQRRLHLQVIFLFAGICFFCWQSCQDLEMPKLLFKTSTSYMVGYANKTLNLWQPRVWSCFKLQSLKIEKICQIPRRRCVNNILPVFFRQWCGIRRSTWFLLIYTATYVAFLALGGVAMRIIEQAQIPKKTTK